MKNLLLVALSFGLVISLYFNYRDSQKIKIDVGKDVLKITFYGIDKIKDSLAGFPPIPPAVEKGGSITLPTVKCYNNPISLTRCGNNVKEPVRPAPGVHPTLDDILPYILQKYKNITIGVEHFPGPIPVEGPNTSQNR